MWYGAQRPQTCKHLYHKRRSLETRKQPYLTSQGDFGTAYISKEAQNKFKIKDHKQKEHEETDKCDTFVGSRNYVSPEVLNGVGATQGADIWSLACIIFELVSGKTPFHSANEYDTFQKIINEDYTFPQEFDSELKDLVTKMLKLNPEFRLGSGSSSDGLDMASLKNHPFFSGIDFARIHQTTSPLIEIYERSETHHAGELFDDLPDSLFETPEYHDEALQFTASIDKAIGNPLARIPESDNEACSIESQSQLRLSGFGKQNSKPQPEVERELDSITEEEKKAPRHHSNVTDEEPQAFSRIHLSSEDSSEEEIEAERRGSRQMSQSTKRVPIMGLDNQGDK